MGNFCCIYLNTRLTRKITPDVRDTSVSRHCWEDFFESFEIQKDFESFETQKDFESIETQKGFESFETQKDFESF